MLSKRNFFISLTLLLLVTIAAIGCGNRPGDLLSGNKNDTAETTVLSAPTPELENNAKLTDDVELVAALGLTADQITALDVLHEKYKPLIEEVKRAGKIPFAYIEIDNYKSINLVSKLGFIKHRNCHWFQIKWSVTNEY